QIRRDVERKLGEFESNLASRVAAERKRLSMDTSELQAVATCYKVVLQLRAALGTRPAEFPILIQKGEDLRNRLTEQFERGSPAELLAHLSAEELAGQFRTDARVLQQALQGELTGAVIDEVYQVVGQRLEGLPPVRIGPEQRECREVWQQFAHEDRAEDWWRIDLPPFWSDDLAGWLAHPSGGAADGGVYAGVVRDKIGVVAR